MSEAGLDLWPDPDPFPPVPPRAGKYPQAGRAIH
jgi:hypothetical protein